MQQLVNQKKFSKSFSFLPTIHTPSRVCRTAAPSVVPVVARKRSFRQQSSSPRDFKRSSDDWQGPQDYDDDDASSKSKEPFEAELLILFGLPTLIIIIPWALKDPAALLIIPLAFFVPGVKDILLPVLRSTFSGVKKAKRFMKDDGMGRRRQKQPGSWSARPPPPPPPPPPGTPPSWVYDLSEEDFEVQPAPQPPPPPPPAAASEKKEEEEEEDVVAEMAAATATVRQQPSSTNSIKEREGSRTTPMQQKLENKTEVDGEDEGDDDDGGAEVEEAPKSRQPPPPPPPSVKRMRKNTAAAASRRQWVSYSSSKEEEEEDKESDDDDNAAIYNNAGQFSQKRGRRAASPSLASTGEGAQAFLKWRQQSDREFIALGAPLADVILSQQTQTQRQQKKRRRKYRSLDKKEEEEEDEEAGSTMRYKINEIDEEVAALERRKKRRAARVARRQQQLSVLSSSTPLSRTAVGPSKMQRYTTPSTPSTPSTSITKNRMSSRKKEGMNSFWGDERGQWQPQQQQYSGRKVPWYLQPVVLFFPFLKDWGGFI